MTEIGLSSQHHAIYFHVWGIHELLFNRGDVGDDVIVGNKGGFNESNQCLWPCQLMIRVSQDSYFF